MTGISAGHVLHNRGWKILIIEAQDYVGGRTKVGSLGNYSFNIGASWIEGVCTSFKTNPKACAYNGHTPTDQNQMWLLAEKYNITSTDAGYFDYTAIGFIPENSGESVHIINKTEIDAVVTKWNNTMDCMWKLLQEMYNEDWQFQDISYKTALWKCGWAPPYSALEKTVEYTQFTFEYAEEDLYTSFFGSEQNIFYNYGAASNFITDPRGFAGITKGLAAEYLNLNNISAEPKLIINSPITKVEHSYGHRVTVTVEPTDGSPVQTYNAKFGIVTFSLGVWQSDIVEYDPPLSDVKRYAYLAETMTDYLPVLVQWPYNFWDKLGITTHVIDFVDERDNYRMWAYNFDHPDFYPGSHVWRFDIITNDARRVQFQSEQMTIDELINTKLKYYFGDTVLPEPVAILQPGWRANKYVQGSYSNWNMGMNSEKWAKMQDPLIEEGLFFGGEAISVYSGDVNGAYGSGITVAEAVIAANL
eukprot:487019_1